MCGICGVVSVEQRTDAEAVVRRMMGAMRHRGPDDEGLFLSPPGTPRAALGMRRLSIIDLAGGRQPVFNEDGNVAVVFNGEIYNFRELRHRLEAEGHVFRTRSDTEAIVHAYEAWGADCVHQLRGMFAFAVLDLRKNSRGAGPRLFLARDRLGIKPLYYAPANGALLFASEVRALLASRWVMPRLREAALQAYLLFGSVAEPVTLVEGVFSVPPGHRVLIPLEPLDAVQGEPPAVRPEAYWNLAEAARGARTPAASGPRTSSARLRPLLEDAVRSHLVADVPLGIFLSSGLDSTAITALASREQHGIHTFTVVFPEQDLSEAQLARRTAERFGTRHEELLLSGDDMLVRLEEAVAVLDQPTMDGINTYFVSWAARQVGLKVALSGLGGDEVFGGYSTFRSTPRVEWLAAASRSVPRRVRAATSSALMRICEGKRGADAARKLAALWRDPDALPHGYFFARALFTPEQVSTLLTRAAASFSSAGGTRSAWREGRQPSAPEALSWRMWLEETARQAAELDSFTGVSCLETRSYLVNTLLRDTDAVSMSHSLEVRVPLLDHSLVEFVAQLPESAKRRRGVNKPLLVEALGEILPRAVVEQRKRTFTFPWERWLRGALREQIETGLAELAPALLPALDRKAVQAVWKDFLAGGTSWSRPWSLFVLNEWCRRHLGTGESAAETTQPAEAVVSGQAAAAGDSH